MPGLLSGAGPRRSFLKHLAAGFALSIPLPALARAENAGPPTHTALAPDSPTDPQGPRPRRDSDPISFAPIDFDPTSYGAAGDGVTVCTAGIQKAVDACAKAGGGKVTLRAGRYLTGPIFLKSNVHFEISAGATLLGSTTVEHYPTVPGRWEGIDRTIYASLFTGVDLENVSITGRGVLDGQGQGWWKAHEETRALRQKLGLEEREPENPPGSPLKWPRPRMIYLQGCKSVLVSGVTLVNSPSWNIHPVLCENVVIDQVTILNPEHSPNTDGIDPDSCKSVRISNCHISTGDDCIVIKSGYKYHPQNVPCEDIVITNCFFGTGHAGVGIGSETAGGVRNVAISNCVCEGTQRGLRIKTARGRGNAVENVSATNIVMHGITDTAISVSMFYVGGDTQTAMAVNEGTPVFRNFSFSNVMVNKARRVIQVEGLPEMPVRRLHISGLLADSAAEGISCSAVEGMILDNIVIDVEKKGTEKGFALAVSHVKELEVFRFSSKRPSHEATIQLAAVEGALIHSCSAVEGETTFLELKGEANRQIALTANRWSGTTKKIAFTNGASEAALQKDM